MVSGTYKITEMQHTKDNELPLRTQHIIVEKDNELEIYITIKIDKRRRDYNKRIQEMIDKQTSPAIRIIKEIEKEARLNQKEGRGTALYKIINKDEENPQY